MGASDRFIQRLFLFEGLLQALISCLLGFAIAITLILVQQQFAVIKLQGTFVVNAFPVSMHAMDFVLVFFTITLIALLAAWLPALRAAKMPLSFHQK
jgi:lipoprotein-releasing system permease protein